MQQGGSTPIDLGHQDQGGPTSAPGMGLTVTGHSPSLRFMASKEKYVGLRAEILLNENRVGTVDWKTVAQIAEQFGCSTAYVYRVRYLLGMKDAPIRAASEQVRLDKAQTEEGQLKDLLSEPLISPLDRLKVLSRLIRTGSPPVKITAIKAYEELTRTSEGRIGPGPPLTRDDKVARITKLLLALPVDITAEAWEIAYGYPPTTAANRATVPPPSGAVPPPSVPVPEPLYDLPIPSNRPPSPRGGSLPSDEESPGPTL